MTVIVRDLGFNALLARLRLLGSSGLTVGIHEDAGEVGGITVGAIGFIHEFGRGNVPERSWMRSTLDNERTKINSLIKDVTRRVISNRRRMPARQALGIIGLDVQRRMQETIRRGLSPPLVVRVGGTPLLDTGQLIASIRFKVV